MSMAKCKECGAEISTKATACPKCGAKVPKRTSMFTWAVCGVALLVMIKCTLYTEESTQKAQAAKAQEAASATAARAAMTPAQRVAADKAAAAVESAKAAEELQFQRAAVFLKAIQAAMKNPDSFKLTQAIRTDAGAVCIEYRGTNSFNAVVPSYAVLSPDGKAANGTASATSTAWNAHCAHKNGKDYSHISHAM